MDAPISPSGPPDVNNRLGINLLLKEEFL
ncbi:hypothetical protein CLS_21820 [[Clostridium] cf. saccharolyticum K10]|nr:hypothetical protein CLS_21820 [[Clostridium] cf. saccharolyticum K10]